MNTIKEADVLIIGTGLAGMSCALEIAKNGYSVILISKEEDSNITSTNFAQGGIVERGQNDSKNILTQDIEFAGCNAGDLNSIDLVAGDGVQYVREYLVNKVKVPFERDSFGNLLYTKEAAHSRRRILYFKDKTGNIIQESLNNYIRKDKNIEILTKIHAIDIIVNIYHSNNLREKYKDKYALGIYAFDEENNRVIKIFGKKIVLACGGIGNIYKYTSNPPGATGDGIAMAGKVGCTIINSEFVQFHPTLLFNKDLKRMLLSEALRGEGALLRNSNYELFMEQYNLKLKELAPRDEVARAIYSEIDKSKNGYVYLDARNLKVNTKNRFKKIYMKNLRALG